MYEFETFTSIGSSFASKVSVRRNGTIGFSQGALMKFGLDKGKWFAVLKYDKSAKVIGIHLTQNEIEPGAIKIQCREIPGRAGKKNLAGQISARAFLDYFGIEYSDRSRAYVPVKDGDHIIVDLKKEKGGLQGKDPLQTE